MYSITKRGMEFEAIVRYQDGHEERMFPSVEEAEQYVVESAKFWNHTDITVDDIAYFEQREVKINQDFPVERDEFQGLYALCYFSRSFGWCMENNPTTYPDAVEQWKKATHDGKAYTRSAYESDRDVSRFYQIHKEEHARMFRS